MNENGGIYGGCLDCEDCKEQYLHCEDCSMYEYDKDRMSNQENNNLKNTLLDVAQNFDKMSDSEKTEVNDNVRKQFNNIIHGKPPKTEREKEIDKLAREELKEYRRKKKAFYDNPIHQNNNKRRRHGLPVLRGDVNKYRSKEYPGFYPSVRFFCMMEDLFDEILITTMEDSFNSFVEVKDLAIGDAKVFRVSEQENNSMELSQNERQKFLELIDKVSPCAAISEKENLEKFKEWLDNDRSKRVTFVEVPKIFKDQVGNDKVLLIPTNDEAIKPIRVIFEGE